MALMVILLTLLVAVLLVLVLLGTDPEAGGGSDRADRNNHRPRVGQ